MRHEAEDDELTEVDSDASEVEHVVPKKILAHSLQWRHVNGGLWRRLGEVAVTAMVPKTDGYVRSAFFGDSKEGLHLVRAYTKRIDAGQRVLKYSESRALHSVSRASARDFD